MRAAEPHSRAVEANNTSTCQRSLMLAKTWLKTCATSHKTCRQSSQRWHPTRLIDVGSDEETSRPRLCDSSTRNLEADYLTLSHVWGDQSRNPIYKLQTGNLDLFQKSIPTPRLTKTFQDAINITRELGFQYVVAVQSYCHFHCPLTFTNFSFKSED